MKNILAAAFATTLFWGAGTLATSGAEPSPPVIIVFGDSLTAGGALPTAEKSQLWVRRVESEAAGQLRLINEGKGGRPTASVPEFEAMLQRQPVADALVIALGTNDSRDISDSCVSKAVANLTRMIKLARHAYGEALPILLVGPPNIRKDALGPTKPIADQREGKLKELGAAYEALAASQRCRFISLFGVVPAASLAKDGVHPDGTGNAAMARVLGPAIRALPSQD
jgi:acyl-CoA thioesterase-1